MVTGLNYVLQLVIFLSLFSIGLSINCFQCNSVIHPGCDTLKVNDTESPYYKKCDGDYQGREPFCRKILTEIMDLEDSTRILRSCGWIRDANATKKNHCVKADTDFIMKRFCDCSSDACNSSDRTMHSFVSLVSVTVVFCVFRQLDIV